MSYQEKWFELKKMMEQIRDCEGNACIPLSKLLLAMEQLETEELLQRSLDGFKWEL